MPVENSNAYLRTKVLTASPVQLRLMLLDGAIRFAEQGRQGLVEQDFEKTYEGISRCQSIVMELLNALRPEHDPQLCDRLSAFYTFIFTRLMSASGDRDPAVVEEVLELLRYDRETWSMLIDRLAEENVAAGGLSDTPDAQPAVPPPTAGPDGLVGGSVSVHG